MNAGIIEPSTQFADPPLDLLGRPTPVPTIGARFGLDPRSLPALTLWFDASDRTGITESGGVVTEWRSKIGGFTATQSDLTACPVYRENAVSGRPGLVFDGVNDQLLTNFNHARLTGYVTYAAAVRVASLSTIYPPIINARNGGNLAGVIINNSTPRRWTLVHRTVGFDATFGTPVALTPQRIVGVVRPSELRLRVNGATSRTAGTYVAGSNLNVNCVIANDPGVAGRFLNGVIGEILVWSRALTETELDLVDAYLAGKWAIGL